MTKSADVLYIGIGSHVVAINPATGEELWRARLKGSSFITLCVKPNAIYAGAAGELFCIDPSTGSIRWKNRLKGLGNGLVSFSDASTAAMVAAIAAAQAAATAATAAS